MQLAVTVLLAVVASVFWAYFRHGFTRQVIRLAVVVVCAYMLLTAVVIGGGLYRIATQPTLVDHWYQSLWQTGDSGAGWWSLLTVCLLAFPKLALSLGGFELSMIVIPLVDGGAAGSSGPSGSQVRNVRKMLVTGAVIMSLYLLSSSLVTSLLIAPKDLAAGGLASNRALAYLAHGEGAGPVAPFFGGVFGTAYDIATVLILCLTGASVTIALRDLVPGHLLRFGMELKWVHKVGATLHIFNGLILLVTLIFAPTSRRSAELTVPAFWYSFVGPHSLSLKVSDARAHAGSWLPLASFRLRVVCFFPAGRWSEHHCQCRWSADCAVLCDGHDHCLHGLADDSQHGAAFRRLLFYDEESQLVWNSLQYLDFHVLVPHRPGRRSLDRKEADIRTWHRLPVETPIVFLEAELGDPSDFRQRPLMQASRQGSRVTLRITRCVSIAHVVAAVALELGKRAPTTGDSLRLVRREPDESKPQLRSLRSRERALDGSRAGPSRGAGPGAASPRIIIG